MGEEAPGARGAALKLSRIVKRYGPKLVLDHVSLAVGWGEKVALAGPNGAGKTTLLKVAGGLLDPDEGVVERRGGAVYVPELDFLPRFTRLADWFAMHGCSLRDVGEALGPGAAEALAPLWGRRPVEMSKGQRRLAGILAALCYASRSGTVVLLDEPFAGLAQGYRRLVAGAVRRAGASVVSAVHGLEEAAMLGDRLYWLEEGRLAPVERSPTAARITVEKPDGVETLLGGYEEAARLLHRVFATGFQGVRRLCVEPAGSPR